jgi:hypothetical protein
MSVITYPLRYLYLTTESGRPLFARNALAVFILALVASAPFLLTDAVYFGADGFLDKFGSFAAVLTGFYIAALVGIATFATTLGDLDTPIVNGPVLRRDEDGEHPLTRRQYVSAMFGYLAFLSMVVSFTAILLVICATAELRIAWFPAADDLLSPDLVLHVRQWVRAAGLFALNMVLAHMFVTTCHGLYYLIDRLYEKPGENLRKGRPKVPSKP